MTIALRFLGSDLPAVALPEGRRILTIGAGDSDLIVPTAVARDVAAVHATVERVDGAIIVRDHGAGHGLYRSPRSPRVPSLWLAPGAVGWMGGCAVLVLDPGLEAVRARLSVSVGLDAHPVVDETIVAVADGTPLALVGPRGLDALPLARAIHDATTPGRAFTVADGVELPRFEVATGTLVVDLDRVRRLPRGLVDAMLDARSAARVIFLATRAGRVRIRLDTYAPRVRMVELVALDRRPADIVRLLAMIVRDELRSDQRIEDLGPRSLRGLAAYRWPRGLDELRQQAARIVAYLTHPSLRRAAAALGIAHQSLAAHLRRIGVVILDQADREPALPPPRSERSPSS